MIEDYIRKKSSRFFTRENEIILEDNDIIIIPKQPDSVIVTGEVNNPVSVAFRPGENYKYYLNKAGSTKNSADKKGIYVIKANGSAESTETGFSEICRGDTVVVPYFWETE